MGKRHIHIDVIPEDELTVEQKTAMKGLLMRCFSDVSQDDVDECFIAQSFARVLAYEETKLVGHLRLFERRVVFDGKDVVLGGLGGVCVSESMRHKNIGTRLMEEGIRILREKGCDVACLNTDLKKTASEFYEKIRFRLMNRQVSFEDVHRRIRYDTGTMFIPICSREIYDYLMDNDKIFHYGKGYW
jgi:predicted GNAT family N-acyltransferase